MAPNMTAAQRATVVAGLEAGHDRKLIAATAHCSPQAVTNIKRNLRTFGSPLCPRAGPPGLLAVITAVIMEALLALLNARPWMYLEELVWFILDEFDVLVSQSTISRALTRQGWSYKTARFVSNSRNYDARNQYLEQISAFASWQLVFVDESGVDMRNGRRKYGWSPLGVSPHAYNRLGRSERFQILPAYTQDGVIATAIYKGSTDNARYEYWLEHSLLPRCNRYPRRHSVVVMDNAGFHHSERMKAIGRECSGRDQ